MEETDCLHADKDSGNPKVGLQSHSTLKSAVSKKRFNDLTQDSKISCV